MERFLARLPRSNYVDRLIFKGGLLLSYYLTIGRETIDVDLLSRDLNTEKEHVEKILNEICSYKLNDGFQMQFQTLYDLDHQHMNYPGFQAKISIQYGIMKDNFYVDIGVGDVVDPDTVKWSSFVYKEKPLFEDSISLEVYPVETIFAEKLETLISRGAANSRMKDYHDLYLICRSNKLINQARLKENIRKTFQNRNTVFTIPVEFSSDELENMQPLWAGHLRALGIQRLKALNLPKDIAAVIDEINKWLLTIAT